MHYYGHKTFGFYYRRAVGIDADGVEISGKHYAWNQLSHVETNNLFPGALMMGLLGQPFAALHFDDGNELRLYPAEFHEEGKKSRRDFMTGISDAFVDFARQLEAGTGKRWFAEL